MIEILNAGVRFVDVDLDELKIADFSPVKLVNKRLVPVDEIVANIKTINKQMFEICVFRTGNKYSIFKGETYYLALKSLKNKPNHIKVSVYELDVPSILKICFTHRNWNAEPYITKTNLLKSYSTAIIFFGLNHTLLADYLDIKRATLSNRLRILKLSVYCLNLLDQGVLGYGACKILLQIENEKDQNYIASEYCVRRKLKDKDLQAAINLKLNSNKLNINANAKSSHGSNQVSAASVIGEVKSRDILNLEDDISDSTGVSTTLEFNDDINKINLQIKNSLDLDLILSLLTKSENKNGFLMSVCSNDRNVIEAAISALRPKRDDYA